MSRPHFYKAVVAVRADTPLLSPLPLARLLLEEGGVGSEVSMSEGLPPQTFLLLMLLFMLLFKLLVTPLAGLSFTNPPSVPQLSLLITTGPSPPPQGEPSAL